jgi:hypothetical protein
LITPILSPYNSMHAKLKKEWLAALRSGNYRQTTDFLERRGTGNCCLGVLCRIAKIPITNETTNSFTAFNGCTANLSEDLLDEFGLTDDDVGHLVYLNDTARKDFSQIAKYIEENL